MSILATPSVATIVIPSVATIITTLPSGYNVASASARLATLTSAAAAQQTASKSGTSRDSGAWLFSPNFAIAVVAVTLYGIVTIALIFRLVRHRTWFMTALILGGIMEALGFGSRAGSVKQLTNLSLYKMQLSCTILAPIFTAAAEYILLGRIMEYVGRRFSLLRPSLVSWIFIISDAISFLIQVGGAAALLARPNLNAQATAAQIKKASDLLTLGDNILLAGLAVNLASFIVFTVQVAFFDYRTRKEPAPSGPWRTLLYALYASSFFVLLRQIYRVIEFSQGWFGYLPTHEGYFYGLDSLPILIASAIYIWFWPTKYIPGDKTVRLSETGQEYQEFSMKEQKKRDAKGLNGEANGQPNGNGYANGHANGHAADV